MLIQFNFRNYKSFRNEASLKLKATKITENSEHAINVANNNVLKVAAIYGANASGKSNVFDAFNYMTYYVVNSFKFGGESRGKSSKEREQIKVTPFMFDVTSREEKTTFEVIFIDQKDETPKIYQYGFSLKNYEVIEEWLNYKSKTAREFKKVFHRSKDNLDLDGISKKYAENIAVSLEKEVLIVSLGARLKIAKLKSVKDWFFGNEVIDFSSPIENFFRFNQMPEGFATDNVVQDKVVKFLASFDDSIKGFEVERVGSDEDPEADSYRIRSKHKIMGSDEMALIPLENESQGTLEMFSLYPSLQEVMENGSILFVDELNTKLHPLLVRSIIQAFINPNVNKKSAQLIFTTHDVLQMDSEILRRDEIWFAKKDSDGISTLYSLADCSDSDGVKIRKDENYEKNYLRGKYGAAPVIKDFDMF